MAEAGFVGIDVSKLELMVAVRPGGESFQLPNDRRGIKRLVEQLRKLGPELVVIEATGGLQRAVVAALWAAEIKVAVITRPGSKALRAAPVGWPRPTGSTRACWRCMASGSGRRSKRRPMRKPARCRNW